MEQIKIFAKYKYLLLNLINRDLKVKYRRSALGILWSVLNPLMMMTIQYFVFNTLWENEIENFAVYLITGNLVYQFFSESTQSAMSSMLGAAPLIKKIYVPKYIFPMEKIMFGLVNMLFSTLALIIVALVTRLPFTIYLVLAPIPILLITVFNLGVGLILSAAVVFFRDIMHLYGVFVMALTYLTPIFYEESFLIEKAPMVYNILRLNPLYWYISMFREIVLYGNPPTLMQLVICSAWAVAMLAIGLVVFKKSQDKFILYV